MNFLILGIIIFFSIHLIPILPIKASLINKLGKNKYKGLFSLISLIGLITIIYGFNHADVYPVWNSVTYSKEIALALMPISTILLAAANMQTNIKRILKHPMLIGIIIWSFVHLLANGDLRSIILFASFGLYSLINIIFSKKNSTTNEISNYSSIKDFIAVVIGLIAYMLIILFHNHIAGVAIMFSFT